MSFSHTHSLTLTLSPLPSVRWAWCQLCPIWWWQSSCLLEASWQTTWEPTTWWPPPTSGSSWIVEVRVSDIKGQRCGLESRDLDTSQTQVTNLIIQTRLGKKKSNLQLDLDYNTNDMSSPFDVKILDTFPKARNMLYRKRAMNQLFPFIS